MHPPSLRLLLGIGAVAAPILFACPLARCQVNTIPGNRGRQVQIDVTIRDSSGEIVLEQAHVELFLNGTPCDQRSTSNGRVTFSISDLGRFTAVVTAPGYQPGQSELSVSEPVKVEMEVDLEREHAGIAAVGAGRGDTRAQGQRSAGQRNAGAAGREAGSRGEGPGSCGETRT